MPTTYVAFDVETTGLDPSRDAIIEIAAITFREAAIVDEFASLVNPLVDIPPFITQLTTITNEMVADAPTLHTLRPRVRGKLGDTASDSQFIRTVRGVGYRFVGQQPQ